MAANLGRALEPSHSELASLSHQFVLLPLMKAPTAATGGGPRRDRRAARVVYYYYLLRSTW